MQQLAQPQTCSAPRASACHVVPPPARLRAVHTSALCRASSQQSTAEAPSEGRRAVLRGALLGAAALLVLPAQDAHAGFKKELKKRKIPEEDYTPLPANGLRVYDLEEGSGPEIGPGDKIVVHYDCLYRGLDVVSSRQARLLGGNRTIAEPYEYVVGEPVYAASIMSYSDTANPLFSGASGPRPPQALSLGAVGMKKGGKRSVLVDVPELGYPKGLNELPEGAAFELRIEVLGVVAKAKA